MWQFISTAIEWITWLIGHAWLVGAFVLYLATMAARIPFKWPVVAPVIAALVFMGAGTIHYQKGFDAGEIAERNEWNVRLEKAVAAERARVKLQIENLQRENAKLAEAEAENDKVFLEFTENANTDGEAGAKAIAELLARIKAKHDLEVQKAKNEAVVLEIPNDYEPPKQQICKKESTIAPKVCPPTPKCAPQKRCRPALLQRVPDEFLR